IRRAEKRGAQVRLDGIPHAWVRMMKASIRTCAPRFSARRMVKEYVERYYPQLLSCAGSDFRVCPVDGSGDR
ncbi:MAG TPA: hypothetical protein PLI31_04790, partial [Methanoregulaceae archaeon]|nr:hypothetical protein [Methanoregulaceae archaeon]